MLSASLRAERSNPERQLKTGLLRFGFASARNDAASQESHGSEEATKATKARRQAERRQTQCFMIRTQAACGARHGVRQLAPPSACGRARLPAFHHGTRVSERTPPLSSSHAPPGAELLRSGRYPLPAVIQSTLLRSLARASAGLAGSPQAGLSAGRALARSRPVPEMGLAYLRFYL